MSELTHDDLDKMTMKEIAKHFGVAAPKPGTKKAEFIERVIAQTTQPVELGDVTVTVPLAGTVLIDPAQTTFIIRDQAGQCFRLNDGQPDEIEIPIAESVPGFPMELDEWVGEVVITHNGVAVWRGPWEHPLFARKKATRGE